MNDILLFKMNDFLSILYLHKKKYSNSKNLNIGLLPSFFVTLVIESLVILHQEKNTKQKKKKKKREERKKKIYCCLFAISFPYKKL